MAELGGTERGGVIEILNRSGQVLQRVPYRGGVLRIGRAYDNDVIVGDPYVSAHHLRFSWRDGRPFVEDLESVNGTWCHRGRKRIVTAGLEGGELVQFGHSQARYLPADASVAPAWRDTARHGFLSLFSRAWTWPLAAVLCLLALALDQLVDSTRNLGPGDLANLLVYPVLGVMLWAGFWSLLNRLIAHRANFQVHLGIATLAVAALILNAQAMPLLCFAFGWDGALPWLRITGQVTILGTALYGHMQYATHGRTWIQAGGAVVLALLLFGSPLFGEMLRSGEFSNQPRLRPLLKPPGVRLVNGSTVDAFFDESATLRQRLEAEADD